MPRQHLTDPDLEFLKQVENDDLEPLVLYLIGSHEAPRVTENLTYQEEYKQHGKDYRAYVDEIIHELQLFAGNSFVNLARGHGIPYRKILCLVCKRWQVKIATETPIWCVERKFLKKVLDELVEAMSVDELNAFVRKVVPEGTKIPAGKLRLLWMAQDAIKQDRFAPYQLALTVANSNLRQWRIVSKEAAWVHFAKAMPLFLGQLAQSVNVLWAAKGAPGPAYRVIVPACCHIAYLRIKYSDEGPKPEERPRASIWSYFR